MSRKSAKRKVPVGSVFSIPLKNGKFAFGVLCIGNEVAFFDYQSDDTEAPEALLELPIAFRVPVAKDELESGIWPIVGTVELYGGYLTPGKYLHKPVGSSQYFIYSAGQSVPAAEGDVRNLEILSTWFSMHIQERLEEYFQGRRSKYDMAVRKQLGISF